MNCFVLSLEFYPAARLPFDCILTGVYIMPTLIHVKSDTKSTIFDEMLFHTSFTMCSYLQNVIVIEI